MKVLLTTLNARYIHSSLALRYLKKYCQNTDCQISIKEFTINDPLDRVTAAIYKSGADIIGFSCYIWNIKQHLIIAHRLKKVKPEAVIIFGGPEVSLQPGSLMQENPFIDYIIRGEGERPLNLLLQYLQNQSYELQNIPGLVYRDRGDIVKKELYLMPNLKEIPPVYQDKNLNKLSNKIIYYETTRGCPFNCSYCLSSTFSGVRYFSMDSIKRDLELFIDREVNLVKFVDRTFNASSEWAREIFEFIMENSRGKTTFHFEIAADLFDVEMIAILQQVPEDLFRFEIGVQSTNPATLDAINRKMDFEKVAENVIQLRRKDNIHLHLDLIAGLPEENFRTFKKSFTDVYDLNPHDLQLGFLKLLPGTAISREAEQYGYKYTAEPPYEVLENNWLAYSQILRLKGVEFILKKYHNSGVFEKSLKYILHNHYDSSFSFFDDFAQHFEKNKLDRRSHSRKKLYDILFEFYRKEIDNRDLYIFIQYLKFDLIFNNEGIKLPYWADKPVQPLFKDKRYQFLKDDTLCKKYLPGFEETSNRKTLNQITFDVFTVNVLNDDYMNKKQRQIFILINYKKGEAHDVTEDFKKLL